MDATNDNLGEHGSTRSPALKADTTQRRRALAFRPQSEALEGRVVLSWASVPPASVNLNASGNDHVTVSTFDRNGNYSHTNSITRNEIDYRTFVAPRSGTYTFQALAYGSQIDTVEALFTTSGTRLAYNDDATSSTNNSKFTATLQAGQSYVLGISNYNHSANGGYQVLITAPSISASASTPLGSVYTTGSATLSGTNLQLYLYGQTRNALEYTDHYITVKILDRNGQAIHTSYWSRGFRTAGDLVPGSPVTHSQTWNIDVSNLDLSRAYRLSIVVGH